MFNAITTIYKTEGPLAFWKVCLEQLSKPDGLVATSRSVCILMASEHHVSIFLRSTGHGSRLLPEHNLHGRHGKNFLDNKKMTSHLPQILWGGLSTGVWLQGDRRPLAEKCRYWPPLRRRGSGRRSRIVSESQSAFLRNELSEPDFGYLVAVLAS